MTRRGSTVSILLGSCLLVAFGTAQAARGVRDLRPTLLKGHNTPHGFTSSSYRVFPRLVQKMPVAGKTCGTQSLKSNQWKQGIHQVFKKPWPPTVDEDDLELCAYLFTSAAPAVSNFKQTQATTQEAASKGIVRPLQVSNIGDGVIAGISPFRRGTGGYFLIFRDQNALVSLSYVYHHTPLISAAAFVHMAVGMDTRLHPSQ